MKIFIINLPEESKRREKITVELDKQKLNNYQFVEAVNGKALSEEQQAELFDKEKYFRCYVKYPTPGQVGCTLSHRKCYEMLLESSDDYALIFEDDILFKGDVKKHLDLLQEITGSLRPAILLLSGWFYYTKEKPIKESLKVCTIYSGYLAHAYIINRKAAGQIVAAKPYFVADDWHLLKKQYHINILGIAPHLVNQDWSSGNETTTNGLHIKMERKLLLRRILIYKHLMIQHFLKLIGFWEPAL